VERTRSFAAVSEVLVLPTLDTLPDLALPGGWDSAHQAGSHSVGSHGSDDASIRGYRYGDDLRKVHWRSTARLGSMMVRQEERPWHGRTTLLLDTRAGAHRRLPAGPELDPRETDSFEWAVSATASIAQYLHRKGRPLDVVIGTTKIAAHHPGAVLDQLATVELSAQGNLGDAMAVADAAGPDATMIALFGTLDERSLHAATSRHRPAGSALALLIDSPSWTSRSPIGVREQTRPAEVALTAAGWRVQRVSAHTAIGDVWAELLSGRSTPGGGDGPAARERRDAQYAGARSQPSGAAADDPSLSPPSLSAPSLSAPSLSPTPTAAGNGHRP
jgi:uncharacterized protein (DUF58 family)